MSPRRNGRRLARVGVAHDRAAGSGSTAPTARLLIDSWQLDRPDLHPARPGDAEMDQGRRPRARPRLQRHRRRQPSSRILPSRRPTACRPGPRRSRRARSGSGDDRGPQRARPHAGDLRRGPGRRQRPAGRPTTTAPSPGPSAASARSSLGAMAFVIIVSVLLSSFLARTIVRPLRRLALAAHRVRLGRSREVKVPRLPSRSDEIGLLARAVSDMSQSLRHRIDNIEAFAADVTHELKNPLASLRSAVDGLDQVKDAKLRTQLLAIARDDVRRLDRLINDISEAARTDAELARAQFDRVDLGAADRAIGRKLGDPAREGRRADRLRPPAQGHRGGHGQARPAGPRDQQYHRQCDQLLAARRAGRDRRRAGRRRRPHPRSTTKGPGVPAGSARGDLQPLPLRSAPTTRISAAIRGSALPSRGRSSKGHDGEIDVPDRDDAPSGARFTISLPAADRP